MKVIVCGAGQVGFNIARYLAKENNDVTIIDQRPELIRKISDTLDVRCLLGHASLPPVLEQAGAADADMIIAVTAADEVNMVACQVARSLFNVPTTIARVRQQSYLQPIWSNLFSRDKLPIDVIISPEIEVARAITRLLQVPGALDVIPLAGDKVRLIGVRCHEDTPLVNTPLRQLTALFPDLNIVVIGIVRQGKAIVPSPEDRMLPGDEVMFVADTQHVSRAMTAFGHEEPEARRIVIFGGGNIGRFLAQLIEDNPSGIGPKLIEMDRERAEEAAKTLSNTSVLHGDVLDSAILDEADVATADTVVAVTNDDETNILSALLAKRLGAKRVMALINKTDYQLLMSTLGIDVVVSPRAITVSKILHYVRRGRVHAAHSLHEGFGELMEADAMETSPLVGKPLKEIKLPGGVLVGAVVRDGKVINPRGSTVVQANDRVVMFAPADAVKKVEKLFSVSLEFF
ncbi:MAG TPA: Trk system potassium transporter TrkA [Rhodospirillaceae bacterium]|nr:Trk system potassium transporter TrkA [Rhodospirillaceae bacterium]